MSEPTRYALYFTPALGSALADFGAAILGDGRPFDSDGRNAALAEITAEPRLYGFHATLKAPMRLADGSAEADLVAAVEALAAHRGPVPIGRLRVTAIGGFIALVPDAPAPSLDLFAAECVAALDPLRAPLSQAERTKRRPEKLSARERALLDRWGYPYVFEAFRFHMTLTGSLAPEAQAVWLAELSRAYDPAPAIALDAVTILRQDGAAPFRILHRIPLQP